MALIPAGHAVYNIINTATSYTGGWYPNNKSINEVNATTKFMVYTGRDISCRTHFYQMNFLIDIQSTSATALITTIQTILKVGSNHHSGFIPSGDHISANGYPYEIHFPEANSRIEDVGPNEFHSALECYAYFEVS